MPIDVTPRAKDSFGARFSKNFTPTLMDAFQRSAAKYQEDKARKEESAALQEAGYDISENIRNPKLRESLLEGDIKNKKSSTQQFENAEREATLSKYLGANVAKLYGSLTEGGKTQLSNVAIESLVGDRPFEEVLKSKLLSNPEQVNEIFQQSSPNVDVQEDIYPENVSAAGEIKSPKEKKSKFEFPVISPPKNRTPEEIIDYEKDIRKENVPIFKEIGEKSRALKNQEDHLDILEDLSDDIPDLAKFMVNRHGEARPLAQMLGLVPPKAERFIKTVKDFITEAKDIFGSRVTNFDLQSFQARLPGLLNSREGRRQIIQQMKIFSEMERNYDDALRNIYKHYGLSKISQEQAQEMAEQMTSEREKELRDQLKEIGVPQYDLQEMPNPAEANGKILEDDQGNKFRSNGTSWEPI